MTKMRIARMLAGISQLDLAFKVGSTQPVIARLEAGGINRADVRTVLKIAQALHVSMVDILDCVEGENPPGGQL